MTKNKILEIKIIFEYIFKNIKNKLKTFHISHRLFFYKTSKNNFQKPFFRTHSRKQSSNGPKCLNFVHQTHHYHFFLYYMKIKCLNFIHHTHVTTIY